MGKSKNKKSKKSEVDEALDNFGGRYEMKYDENGNVTWEKVETEEELLKRLFKESKEVGAKSEADEVLDRLFKEGKIESEADVNTSLEKTLKELFEGVEKTYNEEMRFALSHQWEEAVNEFRTLSSKTQNICVDDNMFRGILLATNAFIEIMTAMITHEPIEAESYTELLNKLSEIEISYKNNSKDVNQKKIN